jgi:hypothetical protein
MTLEYTREVCIVDGHGVLLQKRKNIPYLACERYPAEIIKDPLPEQAAHYHSLKKARNEDPNLLPEKTLHAISLSIMGFVIAASLGVPGCARVEPLGQDLLVVSNGKKNY